MAFVLRTRDGLLDGEQSADWERLRAELQGPRKLVIHLHGGLVSEVDGSETAGRLSRGAPAGFEIDEDWVQIYVVWRTGMVETVTTNWRELLKERLEGVSHDRLFQALLRRVAKHVSGRIGIPLTGRGAAASIAAPLEVDALLASDRADPFEPLDRRIAAEDAVSSRAAMIDVDDEEAADLLRFELETDTELNRIAEDMAAAAAPDGAERARALASGGDPASGEATLFRLNPSARAILQGEADAIGGARFIISGAATLKFLVTHGVSIGRRVLSRFRKGRDHGLYCTIVEEILRELYGDFIGSAIWGFMKQDAADHFRDGGLGAKLLDQLVEVPPERLVVSAHSAGSIFASQLLLAASARGMKTPVDLAFMAPAVRTRLFSEMLAKAGHLIGRFRLFAMEDALESADRLIASAPRLYPRSLLYIVSGLFEASEGAAAPDAPLLGMQRFLTMNPAVLDDPDERDALSRVVVFLASAANGIVYSRTAGDAGLGLRSGSVSHGGFDNDEATVASVSTFFAKA